MYYTNVEQFADAVRHVNDMSTHRRILGYLFKQRSKDVTFCATKVKVFGESIQLDLATIKHQHHPLPLDHLQATAQNHQ